MTEAVSREPARWRRGSHLAPTRTLAIAVVALLAVSAAETVEAAQLVEVRVGRHPEFVRVVFETDAPATFAIAAGGTPGETLVRLEAELAPFVASRAATRETGADVQLESLPGGGTLARIRATVPVRVESQVLDEPPRVVLDLRRANEAAALPPEEEATPPEVDELFRAGADPDPTRPEAAAGVALEEAAAAGEDPDRDPDPVAALLAALPEPPAPAEPPAPVPPAEPPARPEPPALPASVESPLPPVSGAPPAAIAARFDGRSLVIGGIAGLVLGVALSLSSRGRGRSDQRGVEPADEWDEREEDVALETSRQEKLEAALAPIPRNRGPDTEPGPARPEATEEAPSASLVAAPGLGGDSLAADLLQMIQRLDDRAARGDELLAGLHERVEWLDRRTGAQAEELASQRLALARLQRALGQPPVRLAADPGQGTPTPASRPRGS